jgi:hypothetical protein
MRIYTMANAKTAKPTGKKTSAKTNVAETAAIQPEATTPVSAKSKKASMLGLVAKAAQAHKDGHDVSGITDNVPGMSEVLEAAKPGRAKAAKTPKAPREPKDPVIRNKGPRGFRVDSPAWLASIMACKGIALSAANMPKLLDTAAVHNVEITDDLTQAEIVEKISKALVAA